MMSIWFPLLTANDDVVVGVSRCSHCQLEGHRSGAVRVQGVGSGSGNGDYLSQVFAGAGKTSLTLPIQFCQFKDTDGGIKPPLYAAKLLSAP